MPGITGSSATATLSGVAVTGTGASGKVPVASSASAATWAYPPGYEWSYTQITANVNITDTAEATATALISPAAFTPDGSPVLVQFFAPQIVSDTNAAADQVVVTLFEGVTQIGRLGAFPTQVTGQSNWTPITGWYRFTPTAAAHTYKLCAFATSTTGTPKIVAGAAGTNAYVPAYVRFTKV